MAEKWMQGVTKRMNRGAFSAAAKAAGMSTRQFIREVLKRGSQYSRKRKRQAILARTFMASRHG
jgi:hypothetical protein